MEGTYVCIFLLYTYKKGDHHACMTNFYIPDGPLYVRQLVHEDAHLASKRTRKGLQKASEDEAICEIHFEDPHLDVTEEEEESQYSKNGKIVQ